MKESNTQHTYVAADNNCTMGKVGKKSHETKRNAGKRCGCFSLIVVYCEALVALLPWLLLALVDAQQKQISLDNR